jgi:hypothetical protein
VGDNKIIIMNKTDKEVIENLKKEIKFLHFENFKILKKFRNDFLDLKRQYKEYSC